MQCPILVFKASTVLQSLGIIASRTLLPSSDTQGDSRERTYCPTTWNYAYGHHTPNDYSDALFEKGAPAILAHERVLTVSLSDEQQEPATCTMRECSRSIVSAIRIDDQSNPSLQTQAASTYQAQ